MVRRLPALLTILCWCHPAAADQIELGLSAGGGTGLSLGSSDAGSVVHRTPSFVALDLAGRLDIYPGWEVACAVELPVEQTPAAGVTPRIRRVTRLPVVHGTISLGMPMYLAPYTLLGGEVALGARYLFFRPFEAFAIISAAVFPSGSDLPVDGSLTMFNLVIGARVPL